jgi:hypothetical protein
LVAFIAHATPVRQWPVLEQQTLDRNRDCLPEGKLTRLRSAMR